MELDLELPSYEQEKLDTGSIADDDVMDDTDMIQVEDEDVNSPTTSEPVEEGCRPIACNTITGSGDQVDVNMVGANVVHKGVTCEPKNGLEFESKEAAYSFYREYARSVGFGITIKASRRSKKSGKFIDVKIACSRFGSKRESSTTTNPRSCPKTGCKAGMHMKKRQDEKWVIYSFVKEHNHDICPDDFCHAIRGRNKQSGVLACQKKHLQLVLDDGDLEVMLEHFMCMKDENPNFFYAIDLDNEKCLRNVFWVDAKGRHDYSNFYDVVFFDTFYVKNKYKIPCVPIIGVNHHFQFILLGCALIGDENASSFVWLMRTWLKAVSGQAPKVIITDQDKILNEAVADVFPNTRHCFCLWQVLSKIPENLGCVVNHYENFMGKFNKCIYRSWTDEQFEKRWWKMVENFEMREIEWVHSLYEDRKKWVPTYLQNTFLAGMSTPERSGSITSFFDKYMSRDATFKEFIDSYKTFLLDRYEMEAEADSETQNKQPGLRSLSEFEKQMSTIYTDTIFKKFQVEILGAVSCHLQKESEDGTTVVFRVDDFEERQNFNVAWNEAELDICCLCHSFEYRGFLCKHAILVLQMSGFSNIPPHYIMKRWTKDAKIGQTVTETSTKSKKRTCSLQTNINSLQIGFFLNERAFSLRYQTAGMLETVLRQGVLGEDDTGEESPKNLKLPSRRPCIVCENCLYSQERDRRARAFHVMDPQGILDMLLIFLEDRGDGAHFPPSLGSGSDSTDRLAPFLGNWKGHSITKRSGVYGATIAEADTLTSLEMDDNGQLIQDISSTSGGRDVTTKVHWTGTLSDNLVTFDGGYQMTLLPGGMYMGCPCNIAKSVAKSKSFHLEFGWVESSGKRQRLVRTYDVEGLAVSSTYFSEMKL